MNLSGCVDFAQRLVRTESLSGEERRVAGMVHDEMIRLGYDAVRVDEAGNVIGMVRGRGAVPPIMFNAHLDHVAVGDAGRWPSPPFSGEIRNDRLWGRGTVDMKGPLAAQVYAVGSLVADSVSPPGDVYVAAVVQEETGGLGSQFLATYLSPPVVVIGEPSRNELRRGHRGRVEILVHFRGRSAHASVPNRGRNPLQSFAAFLSELQRLVMSEDADLGASSVAPTLVRTDQTSPNVIPGDVWLTCDWRNVPGESSDVIRERLQALAEDCCFEGIECEVTVPRVQTRTYTGHAASFVAEVPPFLTESDHPIVHAAERTLRESIRLTATSGIYRFATDGGWFAPQARAVIGFGPGDDALAHTVDECIEISALETAIQGNRAIALAGLTAAM